MNKLHSSRWIAAALMIALAVANTAFAEKILSPDFTLAQLGSDEQVSLSDYRGQWVVVNYWATYCKPCRKEIPELSALHSERDDVTVLGITYEDNFLEKIEAFLKQYDPTYPILMLDDIFDLPEGLVTPRALPSTFLVDPEGYKVKTFLGAITREELERFIELAKAE